MRTANGTNPDYTTSAVNNRFSPPQLKPHAVRVERFNLAQQPRAFGENDLVNRALAEAGDKCLPLILVDGEIVARDFYPSREELAAMVAINAVSEQGNTRPSSPKYGCGCWGAGGCRK